MFKNKGEGVLGNSVGGIASGVADGYSLFVAVVNVYIVVACGKKSYVFELFRPCQSFSVQGCFVADYCVCVFESFCYFLFGGQGIYHNFPVFFQKVQGDIPFCNCLCVGYNYFHFLIPSFIGKAVPVYFLNRFHPCGILRIQGCLHPEALCFPGFRRTRREQALTKAQAVCSLKA